MIKKALAVFPILLIVLALASGCGNPPKQMTLVNTSYRISAGKYEKVPVDMSQGDSMDISLRASDYLDFYVQNSLGGDKISPCRINNGQYNIKADPTSAGTYFIFLDNRKSLLFSIDVDLKVILTTTRY